MKKLKILLQSRIFLLLSLILLISYVYIKTSLIQYKSLYSGDETTFKGKIIDYKFDGAKLSILLKSSEKLQCTYYFSTQKEKEEFIDKIKLGIEIEVKGELSVPIKNTIPNTFNYQKFLKNKKIFWTLNISKINILDSHVSIFYNIKNYFIKRINNYQTTTAYLYAFILGDSSYIDYETYNNLQNNGVTHLFAVSGMHISLFIVVIRNLLKKLKFKDNNIAYLTIIFLIFYALLVGFTASVMRATLFYALSIFNRRFNINIKTLRLFYLLFFLLLIINPFYIYDVGFIYSFVTSFGLIIFSEKITGNYLAKLLKTSAIAFLFSLPITIYFNYDFNLLTIINNIIVVPIVSLGLFPLSMLTFLFPFLEPILNLGFIILEFINSNLMAMNIVIGKISFLFIIIYYLIVYLIYKYKKAYIIFIVILLLCNKYKPYLDNNSYLYFLDVGQGDATLVITEHRKDIILIDSGGKLEYPKKEWQKQNSNFNLANNIIKFMKSLGLNKISLFIGTHGDFDHMGEAINIVNYFKVEKVIFNCGEYNDLENELIKVLDIKKIEHYSCIKELNISNNKLYFLNTKKYNNENDNSSVVYAELYNYRFLFMGDASTITEKEILDKYKLSNIDVLKVGHHGSKTSSSIEFINTIKPKFSIISVGKNNRYGHPNKETLGNLEGSKIYRTDIDGSIMFKLKKGKLDIETCPP